MPNPDQLSPDQIQELLAARQAEPYENPYREMFVAGDPRPAAVLIPLLRVDDRWEVLFIRRSSVEGDHHSGQVAFPGGRQDPGDASLVDTALREAREEIALDGSGVRILGRLEDFITITNYKVAPFVAHIPWPSELTPDPNEVQRIFTIPLAWLADPANHAVRQRDLPESDETLPVIYFDEYEGELLWGASARFTLSLLEALGLA